MRLSSDDCVYIRAETDGVSMTSLVATVCDGQIMVATRRERDCGFKTDLNPFTEDWRVPTSQEVAAIREFDTAGRLFAMRSGLTIAVLHSVLGVENRHPVEVLMYLLTRITAGEAVEMLRSRYGVEIDASTARANGTAYLRGRLPA